MVMLSEQTDKVFAMGVCSHVYHQECINPWLQTCIENGLLPIHCPEPECKQPIPLPDLQKLLFQGGFGRCQKLEWKDCETKIRIFFLSAQPKLRLLFL